jgi:ribosomal protein L11 methyltransferase
LASYPALDVRFPAAPGAALLQDLLHAALDAFQPLAIHEHDPSDRWRVFFPSPGQRDQARAALASAFGDRLLALSAVDVEDDGWARRSQASLEAVHVGRITVAPPWDVPASRDPDRILIVIEPSMGFGTGHHATTRLCLELMQQIDFGGTRVMDVGTGSGVLALAAWRLGAASVIAVDYDPDALQNARDNIARNGGTESIQVVQSDLSAVTADPADVVLANLTAAILQRHAGAVRRMVWSDLPPEGGSQKRIEGRSHNGIMNTGEGTLVVSGFSPDELDDVACAFGLTPRVTAVEGEWAAAMF